MSFDGTYHYVRHADVSDFESCGWVFAFGLGRPHGTYSVCMRWNGEGEPRVPKFGTTASTESGTVTTGD
jgi:hypothetical protein